MAKQNVLPRLPDQGATFVADMNANVAKIDAAGRLSISAQHRKALGWKVAGPWSSPWSEMKSASGP